MLIARAYTVLDSVVVEVTCHHPGRTEQNHLVIREERRGQEATATFMLRALADVADTAAYLASTDRPEGRRERLCEEELEWASPSD